MNYFITPEGKKEDTDQSYGKLLLKLADLSDGIKYFVYNGYLYCDENLKEIMYCNNLLMNKTKDYLLMLQKLGYQLSEENPNEEDKRKAKKLLEVMKTLDEQIKKAKEKCQTESNTSVEEMLSPKCNKYKALMVSPQGVPYDWLMVHAQDEFHEEISQAIIRKNPTLKSLYQYVSFYIPKNDYSYQYHFLLDMGYILFFQAYPGIEDNNINCRTITYEKYGLTEIQQEMIDFLRKKGFEEETITDPNKNAKKLIDIRLAFEKCLEESRQNSIHSSAKFR